MLFSRRRRRLSDGKLDTEMLHFVLLALFSLTQIFIAVVTFRYLPLLGFTTPQGH